MELWLDTANLSHIKTAIDWGVISGVTTNPTLVAREGYKMTFKEIVKTICELMEGPVSAEVISFNVELMIKEARELADLASNVVVKIPITKDGLKAISTLFQAGVNTNCTLIFSPNQAVLAALAGANYVSPFVGRIDDIGYNGMEVVRDIAQIFKLHNIKTRIIAASIRHPMHVITAAKAGVDVVTLPFSVLEQMTKHPLTDIGISRFITDWKNAKISFD